MIESAAKSRREHSEVGEGLDAPLVIAESDVAEPTSVQPVALESQPFRKVAGFGEIDSSDSAGEDDSDDEVDDGYQYDDEDLDYDNHHSSASDARHGLGYVHDQQGQFLGYLLRAS